MREMAGILDMAALGASEAPADLAFSLKGALRPAVRDDDVEYEGMCRCLRARGEFAGSSHPTGALNVLYSRAQDLAARPVHSAPATQSLASRPQSYRTQGFRDPSEAVPADERSTARSAENYHP